MNYARSITTSRCSRCKVLVTGGAVAARIPTVIQQSRLAAEMWDPATDSWTTLAVYYLSRLSCYRVLFPRSRSCWWEIGASAEFLAALSVQGSATDDHFGSHKRELRPDLLRWDTRCDEHHEGHLDSALFSNAHEQYGATVQLTELFASSRRPERHRTFEPEFISTRVLHAVHPKR